MSTETTTKSLDALTHQEIYLWLKRALNGHEILPQLTLDESPHLGIFRLSLTLAASTQLSIWTSCLDLLREFCITGTGEKKYIQELLFLASSNKYLETTPFLLLFVENFLSDSEIDLEIRQSALAALIDSPTAQTIQFWNQVFQKDKENFSGMVLSGLLEIDPMYALKLLPSMPDDESIGQISALNLELTFDILRGSDRTDFIKSISKILNNCKLRFAAPIRLWLRSMEIFPESSIAMRTDRLQHALIDHLGDAAAPRTLTTKLCNSSTLH